MEDVTTSDAFARDPALVYRFYNECRHQLLSAQMRPNTAHTVELNLQASFIQNQFTEHHFGPASVIVTPFLRPIIVQSVVNVG